MTTVNLYLLDSQGEDHADSQAEKWTGLVAGLSGGKIGLIVGKHSAATVGVAMAPSALLTVVRERQEPNDLKAPAVVIGDTSIDMALEPPGKPVLPKGQLIYSPNAGYRDYLVLGTTTKGPWSSQKNLPMVLRAIFLLALGVPLKCSQYGCVAHADNGERNDSPPGRIEFCSRCRQAHPDAAPLLDSLASWLYRNRAQHVTVDNLATVSPRRLQLLNESMAHRMRVDTPVLIALAEENPPSNPSPLDDSPRKACKQLFDRAIQAWRPDAGALRTTFDALWDHVCDLDALAYLTTKRHREHTDHCLAVGLLSDFLLSVEFPQKAGTAGAKGAKPKTLADRCGASAENIRGAMWLAAVAHDIGYPLCHYLAAMTASGCEGSSKEAADNLKKLGQRIFTTVSFPVGWDEIGPLAEPGPKLLDAVYKSAIEALNETIPSSKFLKRYLKYTVPAGDRDRYWGVFDHGIWSHWVLVHFLRRAKSLNAFLKDSALAPKVAEAIAFHNLPVKDFVEDTGGGDRLDFHRNPLLFLLRLCDAAQEWDRHILSQKGLRTELQSVAISGIYRPIGQKAVFVGRDLLLHLEYTQAQPMIDSRWNYDTAVASFEQSLHTLRFPSAWASGPERVGFQIRSPIFVP